MASQSELIDLVLKLGHEKLTDLLIARASEDSGFREELLSSPKTAIAKEIGMTVPEDVIITVVEEKANHVYLVLPRNGDLRAGLTGQRPDASDRHERSGWKD